MTVYHAARPGTGLLGRPARGRAAGRSSSIALAGTATGVGSIARPGVGGRALPRRQSRPATRAGLRGGRVGVALAVIALVFGLAFFSLSQTVRLTASGYDVDRLTVERNRLEARRQELLNDLNRLGQEPAIRRQAIVLGLSSLTAPLVVGGQ